LSNEDKALIKNVYQFNITVCGGY